MQFVKIMVPSGQCKINYTMWYNLALPHIVKLATSWNLIGGMMQPTHPFLCLQNWAYISIYRFLQWNTYCTTKLQIKKKKKILRFSSSLSLLSLSLGTTSFIISITACLLLSGRYTWSCSCGHLTEFCSMMLSLLSSCMNLLDSHIYFPSFIHSIFMD